MRPTTSKAEDPIRRGEAPGLLQPSKRNHHVQEEEQAADDVARRIELEIHPAPDWDPFARAYGLA